MIRKTIVAVVASLACALCATAGKYVYDTVPGDPTNTKIYTLPNGLRIYMATNDRAPRLQTDIAVRVGGKNDPAETTGLAHYFEHLMFKGTKQFGTQDYERERPMLDTIEALFERYRMLTDSTERARMYHRIDSVSYAASLIAIPNEYDKLMGSIGANGTNAYTSDDATCYVEDIPSNQIANWARVQADRFKNPVLRGFHTELETIYEEYNMGLTRDPSKAIEAIAKKLFPHHPYGTQQVIGTQQHLKNPSITNVRHYHDKWYRPNNMAVIAVGDFDPDQFVDIVTANFADMVPADTLMRVAPPSMGTLTAPADTTVWGNDAESVFVAWQLPASADAQTPIVNVLSQILSNDKCGLIDKNLVNAQKLLGAYVIPYQMADAGQLILWVMPKEGQTLEQARDLVLEQIAALRAGNFDADMLQAVVNNLKLDLQKSLVDNYDVASYLEQAFVNGMTWADYVAQLKATEQVTKADVVDFANRYLRDDNYVVVYKRLGPDKTLTKIAKPPITPIVTNRDAVSDFVSDVASSHPEPIEPQFVDFERDIVHTTAKNGQIPLSYVKNTDNDVAQLWYIYDFGTNADKRLDLINEYPKLLGTPDMTADEINARFYELACDYDVWADGRRTYVRIQGLSENMPQAVALFEKMVSQAVPDTAVWAQYGARLKKAMTDQRSEQTTNFSRLNAYALYYPLANPQLENQYTPSQLDDVNPADVVALRRDLSKYPHRAWYHGPQPADEVVAMVDSLHRTPAMLAQAPINRQYPKPVVDETVIYIAPYDANQVYMGMTANRGKHFDATDEPMRQAYNEYFDGSMNSIVFQEMRESRSLAYSASARMRAPQRLDDTYGYSTFIATQTDKVINAIRAFNQIIDSLPQSREAFAIAKQGLDNRLRTDRTLGISRMTAETAAADLGRADDGSQALFEALPSITLDDVAAWADKNVTGNKYRYYILGRVDDLDLDELGKIGRVVVLDTADIFGY